MKFNAKEYWVDGGCHFNGHPDKATTYGSYTDGEDIVRIDWGRDYKTNNEAEYATLRALLEGIHIPMCADCKQEPAVPRCPHRSKGPTIYTDSRLMVGQMMQGWKLKAVNLAWLAYECYELIQRKHVTLEWVSRKVIVEKLGH